MGLLSTCHRLGVNSAIIYVTQSCFLLCAFIVCFSVFLCFNHKDFKALYEHLSEEIMFTYIKMKCNLLFIRFGPYFCQPVIAGLSDEDKPFICTMDSIGAK